MDPKLKTYPETSIKPTQFLPNFSLPQTLIPNHETKPSNPNPNPNSETPSVDWDPHAMLTNLSFLEQKIQQVISLVQSTITQETQFSNRTNELATRQQLVTADLTCIIIQLISTAGSLLPSIKNSMLNNNPSLLYNISKYEGLIANFPESSKSSEFEDLLRNLDQQDDWMNPVHHGPKETHERDLERENDHETENDHENEHENLPIGSYKVLQLEKEEILAPHTHFCNICGKGFKRDANLRMHMRGHGDEYKTPSALSKPVKQTGQSDPLPITRYSCPFIGCKRNKEHKKFQPLKTILCVKNHYKRSHCDKSFTCSRCGNKKFSVIADLKTHEKHCGRDKWQCSCGTTFSRKDKLFGHVALFQGHTPVLEIGGSSCNLGEVNFEDFKGVDGNFDGLMGFEAFDGFDLGENSFGFNGEI